MFLGIEESNGHFRYPSYLISGFAIDVLHLRVAYSCLRACYSV